jgi:hypothetical protein
MVSRASAVEMTIALEAASMPASCWAKIMRPICPHTFCYTRCHFPSCKLGSGHEHIQSTMIYTQVLALETGHLMAKVEF